MNILSVHNQTSIEYAFSLSPQELFGSVVQGYENDTLMAGILIGPFSYDGSLRHLWMMWRRNNAESFILVISKTQFYFLIFGATLGYLVLL